jgi:hypothetical protein
MKNITCKVFATIFFVLIPFYAFAVPTVGDSIMVPRIVTPPVIDGAGTDLCWDSAAWNPMPYVWIPYGTTVPAADFTGRFKTVWNEQENLMYFLFEITDDIFVNGYVFSPSNGNYYLYDVVEIFIDENRSGGLHETTNNAFAYHITGGNSGIDYDAIDMYGANRVNYRNHFPEFKRVKVGNVYTWEFSMMVLKDNYTPTSVLANCLSTLAANKVMGFSAAYCDDDQSSANPTRDHFIASKYQTLQNSNISYQNATYFGYMKLITQPTANLNTSVIPVVPEIVNAKIFPNPVVDFANISFSNNYSGPVDISVFDLTGQLVKRISSTKSSLFFDKMLDLSMIKSGLYFIKVNTESEQAILKVIR